MSSKLFLPATVDTYRDSRSVTNFRGPFERKIIIASLPDKLQADISTHVTQVSISYSISQVSELSFDVVDVDLLMSRNNYFILGRDVIYETHTLGRVNSYTGEARPIQQLFEIANVTVSQGPGGSAVYSVKCYTKAVQQMKRDKKPGSIKGNGSQYIRNAAKKYGLDVYYEETSKAKTISKSSGSKQTESLWEVMLRLADDAKFVLFEVDGILVFASEKFLMHKWVTDIRYVEKTVADPKTKKKKKKRLARRFIPLQWPNGGEGYIGTPGYFRLVERPTFTKSSNDPYAGEGSCLVERFNATQIRPGMTAYVGRVPNMSGYYLIASVSYNEMVPDPVSIQFRTLTRDEEKDKLKLLPIGKRYQQTAVIGQPIRTTTEAAQVEKGNPISKPAADKRITGDNLPTAEFRYRYPVMEYANISRTYAAYLGKMEDSTNSRNTVIITGNIDLWERPVLLIQNAAQTETYGIQTLYSITHVVPSGSEYRAIILPSIYTENGQPVIKTEAQIIEKYNAAGGYSGTAKHLGVVAGPTFNEAVLNARDYSILLSLQSNLVTWKRFPAFNLSTIVATPGSLDSQW
jgi:hypothetical protein